MSKIYEALLRAEQERLASKGKPAPAHEPAEPTATVEPEPFKLADATIHAPVAPALVEAYTVLDPGPAYVELPPVFSVQPIPTQPILAEPAAAPKSVPSVSASIPGVFNPNAITRVQWTPALEKLPSLLERGTGVEQFRSLRTRLFAFRDLNTLKSILVSSGLPKEGKSFVAANLAISFARHKQSRVLLIDGDMRRSSLHNLLGCDHKVGLSNYLAGKATLMETLQRPEPGADGRPLPAGLSSLTFLPGGDQGDIAADLSGSPKFRELIEMMSQHFDWIVVDSSPVNLVTDGVNLATACDASLLVARGGVTKFEVLQHALGELKNSKILGVVLNAVEHQQATTGYYGYDSYNSYDPIKTEEESTPR